MSQFLELLKDYRDFIPDFQHLLEHLKKPFPVYFRFNTIKIDLLEARGFLQKEKVKFQDTAIPELVKILSYRHERPLLSYHLGYIYPQALSSCLPVLALGPKPGEWILDLCAAPGGKATYIAQQMEDKGFLVANDRKRNRITSLLSNIKRLGITNTLVTQGRGEHLSLPYSFDKILVDAPCSGQGRYRLDPKTGHIKHVVKGKTNLPAIQKALIKRAYDLLRPGGILVYSTCTLNVEENEEVIQFLLERRRGRLIQFQLPVESSPGITSFKGKKYDRQIQFARRLYPHKIDSVGFFIAKAVKPGPENGPA